MIYTVVCDDSFSFENNLDCLQLQIFWLKLKHIIQINFILIIRSNYETGLVLLAIERPTPHVVGFVSDKLQMMLYGYLFYSTPSKFNGCLRSKNRGTKFKLYQFFN